MFRHLVYLRFYQPSLLAVPIFPNQWHDRKDRSFLQIQDIDFEAMKWTFKRLTVFFGDPPSCGQISPTDDLGSTNNLSEGSHCRHLSLQLSGRIEGNKQ